MYYIFKSSESLIKSNIQLIKKGLQILSHDFSDAQLMLKEMLLQTASEVTEFLFGNIWIVEELAFQKDELKSSQEKFLDFFELWLQYMKEELEILHFCKNELDFDFHHLMHYFRVISLEALQQEILFSFENLMNKHPEEYEDSVHYLSLFTDFWGEIDLKSGNLDMIEKRAKALKNHVDDFEWLYKHLG